ncbi:MAG: spiro-SPASM protein [Treponema sp.]|jgi:spiro-SPASM protein|nr:spiro-SPASM protein [Treponema sp.]
MNALLILYGGNLSAEAFEPLFEGKNSVLLCIERSLKFPGVGKTILFASQGDFSFLNASGASLQIEQRDSWTKRSLLERISELQAGFDCIYFAFADSPFLDTALALSISERHIKHYAQYSYADGFPNGLTPEVIAPGTAGILAKILGDDDGPVARDILFSVIEKDINAFDIETEISPVDLRCHRLNLSADSKRNLLLLKNFISAAGEKLPSACDVEKIIQEKPQVLRTLPSFYPIQVYGGCPQKCAICPYPLFNDIERKDFIESKRFEALLDKIIAFSGDAVIDLSLWGELSLHPEKMKLIEAVISRPELALVIETSGIGWKTEELEKTSHLVKNYSQSSKNTRLNQMPPLSWIVSLDTIDPKRYVELRGQGFAEAQACAKKLLSLFPNDCYAQAVRLKDAEDDTEKFYRYWKEASPNGEKNIIIQKYDDFCGVLEKKQASDISPVIRQPCWHLMRDMPVLIDGTVPLCREYLAEDKINLGNVFDISLEAIWRNGERYYLEQCVKNYTRLCANCDEYYTYNF